MKTFQFFCLLAGVMLVCLTCKQLPQETLSEFNPDVERQLVSDAIHNSICWAMTKDTVKLYGSMVQDTTLFIFHPDSASTVTDFKQIRRAAETTWLDDRFKATECNIKNLRIQLSQGGDVAWYSCFLDDIGEWDGRAIGWHNVRWTGVLEKRDGNWVIMQMHFSFPDDRFR
ncbi:MAG: hypothetical protein AMS27_01275 [Bacteroides sp. SM23_62_1]|nr:MAG: hypothetical protein AMS27_01275 [Bacteroides sp. SM23_62_1]